ncbi:MAG: low molecular weight protein tyrosine phosphatase family protein [Verrucomicrobiota bacterium]
MKHLLFICSQNKLRSPTAEAVFAGMPGIDVDSAGLNNDAVVPLSPEQVEWADLIFVMEKEHRNKLHRKFKRHLNGQRVIVLGIPDEYEYMDLDLIQLLKVKMMQFL